jgi:hypothetical protein
MRPSTVSVIRSIAPGWGGWFTAGLRINVPCPAKADCSFWAATFFVTVFLDAALIARGFRAVDFRAAVVFTAAFFAGFFAIFFLSLRRISGKVNFRTFGSSHRNAVVVSNFKLGSRN